MKVERLDRILVRLGFVNEEQIAQALHRQREQGGRLGSNLLSLGYLSPEQLAEALSEQYQVPFFRRREHRVDPAVVRRLPREMAEELLAVPFAEVDGNLRVALANPEHEEALYQVEHRLGQPPVELYVAPESSLLQILAECFDAADGGRTQDMEEVSELVGDDPLRADGDGAEAQGPGPGKGVLLVACSPAFIEHLPPLLEGAGQVVTVACDAEQVAEALSDRGLRRVLVEECCRESFEGWIRAGGLLSQPVEVDVLSSLDSMLLDSPVPYERMMGSLLRTLQVIVRYRCSGLGWNPPYDFICRDIRSLSKRLGFRRLVVDGLEIAAHLLLSERSLPTPGSVDMHPLVLLDFDESLELARALEFPWDLEGLLHAFLEIISELRPAGSDGSHPDEMRQAAQVLALVWYRYSVFHNDEGSPREIMAALQTRLLAQVGRIASRELIDAYIQLLRGTKHEMSAGAGKHAFVIAEPGRDANRFTAHLELAGYRTVQLSDMDEALNMCRRHPPAVVLVDYDAHEEQAVDFKRTAGAAAPMAFYAYTNRPEPDFVPELLNAGYVDVFAAPLEHDHLVARISRALQSHALHGSALPRSGSFAASFEAFSFIELIQALGQSRKTVHIALANPRGEQADIFLDEGLLAHAVCGDLRGEEAVYAVMGWGEEGWFSAEPVRDTPAPNVQGSNDGILLEGCRRLDEATV